MLRASRLLPLVLTLVALAVTQSAAAAGGLDLRGVDTSEYPTISASVVTPTPSSSAPSLRENGTPVVGFEAENLARAKSVVLAIDRSQSMRGAPLTDASSAARAFLAAKPTADRIAVLAVGFRALPLTTFSSATIDADQALRGISSDGKYGTALWDSVVVSSQLLASEELPARVLILLTDGQEVSSAASLAQATSAARNAGVAVYVIGIESEKFEPGPLRRLASSTGGSYYSATTSAALASVYASIAEELKRTWRVSYLTRTRPGDSLTLEARLAGATPAKQSLVAPGKAAAGTGTAKKLVPGFLFDSGLGRLLLAIAVGGCVLLAVGLGLATPSGVRLRRRIEHHASDVRGSKRKAAPRERFAAAEGMLSATERALGELAFWHRLHGLLERADLPLRTVEFFYIIAGSALVSGLVATVAGLSPFVALGATAVGGAAPLLVVTYKARKRMQAIDDQLPDVLMTIAASLKAGHSFRQGLQAVVEEGQPPISNELKRVLTETSLGRPMDDALSEMSDRLESKNLRFVITAVTIQRQVGGSLAGIFDMVADAVRQRQQFARKIQSLTAMGRMSAYTLVGLPFFIGGALTLLNREYMDPLYNTSTGHMLIVIGLSMIVVGSLFLKKIVSFRG
jgi:tight adherence protein B